MRVAIAIMLFGSGISYASPEALPEEERKVDVAQQHLWMQGALAETNAAVDQAQREIVLVPLDQLRVCHTRHIDKLQKLQRVVQNATAADGQSRSPGELRRIAIAREKAVELNLHGACPHSDGVRVVVRDLPTLDDFEDPPFDPLYLETFSPTPRLRW